MSADKAKASSNRKPRGKRGYWRSRKKHRGDRSAAQHPGHPKAGPQQPHHRETFTRKPMSGAFGRLIPHLQSAIHREGYSTPTPIQAQSIPHLLNGRDLLGSAQTGTGKTAAFALPILQFLEERDQRARPGLPSALILAPTRELAAQIGESIAAYGRHTRVKHTVIFGGVKQHAQVKALREGVHIAVATPGRLLDLMEQKILALSSVSIFVLDEADRMLDMGFLPDIRKIIRTLPTQRQSLLFSATLPEPIVKLSGQIVHNPVHVTIAPEQPAVEKIEQKVLFVDQADKMKLLTRHMKDHAMNKALIFVKMKHRATRVARQLRAAGITAAEIHGDRTQAARTRALDQFKRGKVRALVATDIAARGIDVEGISHVINCDMPQDAETYIHRIGRTARAGAGGDAVSYCSAEERDFLRSIEKLLKKDVPVDLDHDLHSEKARRATGPAAKPPPKRGRPPRRPYKPRPLAKHRRGKRRGS